MPEIVFTNADDSEVQQVQDMEDLIAAGCDLILISPLTSEALTDVCQRCPGSGDLCGDDRPYGQLRRSPRTSAVTNLEIAAMDAEKLIELTGGKGTVVECAGTIRYVCHQ